MKPLYVICILAIAALILAGCKSDTDGVATPEGGAKNVTVDYCYRVEPDTPDAKGPCWVTLPDGMQCLRNTDGHGANIYTPCVGGRYEQLREASERSEKSSDG